MAARPDQHIHDAVKMKGCEKHLDEINAKPDGLILKELKDSHGHVTNTMVIGGFHGLRPIQNTAKWLSLKLSQFMGLNRTYTS